MSLILFVLSNKYRRTNGHLVIGTVMAFVLRLQKSAIWWYTFSRLDAIFLVKIINGQKAKKSLAKLMSLQLVLLLLFTRHAYEEIASGLDVLTCAKENDAVKPLILSQEAFQVCQ